MQTNELHLRLNNFLDVIKTYMPIEPSLLHLSASGDRLAQHKFYKESYSLLMSVCSRYTINHDDALALLNQGFLKILLNANKYQDKVPLSNWMRRVMINTVIDEFRKSKNYKQQTDLKDFSDHSAGEFSNESSDLNSYEHKIHAEMLETMLKKLPLMSGKVFNLFAIDGYSHKEIAELLKMSEGTSKWHVNNARNLLKEMIKEMI